MTNVVTLPGVGSDEERLGMMWHRTVRTCGSFSKAYVGTGAFRTGTGRNLECCGTSHSEEIWYFLGGRGEMWRKLKSDEVIVEVGAGVCIVIPVGTHFQFWSFGYEPLAAIGATMPPWPGEGEASSVTGPWTATVEPGPM